MHGGVTPRRRTWMTHERPQAHAQLLAIHPCAPLCRTRQHSRGRVVPVACHVPRWCVPHVTFSVAVPRAPIKSARATTIALYGRALHSAPPSHWRIRMLSPRTRQTLRNSVARWINARCTSHDVCFALAMHVGTMRFVATHCGARASLKPLLAGQTAAPQTSPHPPRLHASTPVHAHQHSRTHASARTQTHARAHAHAEAARQ